MDDRTYSSRTRHDAEHGTDAGRFGRWLSSRPAESWMFFAAGLVLGSFFL
ncbi:MAG: hypothetical protein AAFR41_01845 [Pseudomonadota bacterium]